MAQLRYAGRQVENTEWLDASARTVRREINGPSLVAVPADAKMLEHYLMARDPLFETAIATELDGRFGLWAPDPTWHVEPP